LWFPVARDSTGGIETFLPGLIAELEKMGARNTIIASGDSRTHANLVPAVPVNIFAQMEARTVWEYTGYEQHQLLLALEMSQEFDVVHSHIGWGAYIFSSIPGVRERILHTQHNPVTRDLEWFVSRHPDIRFSTVSEFQARKLRQQGVKRCQVIHNGIDVEAFTFQERSREGLLFIGRIEHDKGPDLAIRVAQNLGCPLVLAGPAVDQEFFDNNIKPFLDGQIRYLGPVDHRQKNELLGQSGCVLMPSRCEEGFGLVSLEAMACGTPVVGLTSGALPEIIDPGLTGYVTEDEQSLADLVMKALKLDRNAIRANAAARFSLSVAAQKYHQLYIQIATAHTEREIGGKV
jgi:glycosyltransferase involved in cell wall biosynthesis